jgi:aminoglycoside 2'-N-acetyltransferase I
MDQFHLVVVNSVSLSKEKQSEIISFCNRAFGEDLKSFFSTYNQATHILGYHSQTLVSHVMWLTRWLQVGTSKVMRTAYVEMVATEKSHRARGYGTAMMERVAEEIQDFDLGALSPFSVAFYERLGWELWRGPLFIRTEGDLERTPRDGDVMILRLPKTPPLDLFAPLSAEWRQGELW